MPTNTAVSFLDDGPEDAAHTVILAHGGGGPGDKERAGKLIERQTGAIKVLLDDLLDIARMRLGRLSLHRRIFAFASALDRAIEMTKPGMDAGRLTLSVEKPDAPLQVNGDEVRLGQVLGNLLSNATKYTPPGGQIAPAPPCCRNSRPRSPAGPTLRPKPRSRP